MNPCVLISQCQPHPLPAIFPPLTIIDKTRPFQLNWGSSLPTPHSTPFSVPCILYKLVVRSGGLLRNRTEYCVCVLTWFGFLARIHPVCLCDLSGCDWGVSWGFAGRDWPLRGEGWCEEEPGAQPTTAPLSPAVQRAVSLFSLNDPALSPDVPPAHSPVHSHLSLERGPPTPRTTPTMR